MKKPRVIIADEDENYIVPLQFKFVKDFYNRIDLEIITNREYFDDFFSGPQNAEILVVSDALYDSSLQKHNIADIFVMMEQFDESGTGELNLNRLFKYTSIKEIFNEIIGKSAGVLNIGMVEKQETQIILITSAAGGVGKTTVAMGVAASLTKNYKRVLYINAAHLQIFQHLLENQTSIVAADVYASLASETENIYNDMKHVIRQELFHYFPPFKASLMSLGLKYSVFEKLVLAAKKSGDYDFIVVDTDVTFDDDKAALLNIADKVMIVTKQNFAAVSATNILVSNINGAGTEKYIFICNDFNRDSANALISPAITLQFTVSEYIGHIENYDNMKAPELSQENSIQKTALLVI